MVKKQKRNIRKGLIPAIFGISAVLFLVLFLLNKWIIEITLNGEETVRQEFGTEYTDAGAQAYYTGTLFRFIHKEADVTVTSEVDVNQLGEYKVTYVGELNGKRAEAVRHVIVEDTTPPVITLTSDPDFYTLYNHPYEEEGFKAEDLHDGDLTEKVVFEEKDGKVYYRVSDSSGNEATAERTIVYDDRTPPVITLDGGAETVIATGSKYEDKFSASDDCDGDVTASVQVSGSVDTSKTGYYTLTYTVTDEHGNKAEASRTVYVRNKSDSGNTDAGHIIYLTFDDGPGQFTDQLLDVLDKYDVKVTFFVTGAYPKYAHCMKREAEAGHTVAVHTYTHDYAKVYASAEAYWNDFNKINDVIEKQTGKRAALFRFPGGSSNTVSKNYCKGVVTAVAQQAAAKGYKYFDWNVSSGDAGQTKDTDRVYQNVISGIQSSTKYGRSSVVLQHDVKSYSVAAVERIIQWGLQNGYTFMPLSSSSPTAHHNIAN